MDKKMIFILSFGIFIILSVLFFFFFRSNEEIRGAEGVLREPCPVTVYQAGQPFNSPCELRPYEECLWYDADNCEYAIRNIGDSPIHKGQRTTVFRSAIKGTTQFLDIQIIEIQ